MAHIFVRLITSPNIYLFSKLFRCQNQEKIRNNTITKCQCLKSNNWKHWLLASPARVRRLAARQTH